MPANALDHITVKGFRSIASIEKLQLRPINLLIGANGSGKSNFIGVFSFLRSIREGRLREYVAAAGGAERILHFGSKNTKQIDLWLSFNSGANEYDLMLKPTADDGLSPTLEFSRRADSETERSVDALSSVQKNREAGISDPTVQQTGAPIRTYLGGWRIYHLHDTSASSPMRKTASLDDNHFLRPDGSNLPAFLFYLKQKHRTSYDLIRRTIQQVTPFFDDFDLQPLNLNPNTIKLEWRHKNSDQYFDASSLSDGTLRFIALAVLFLQPEELRPSLILVDEPELGLHPFAIEILASLIKQASIQAQVIVSTQSSLLLDYFGPEDVLVADRVDGGTEIRRLDPAQLKDWLESYSLGQLWEKNELGGRPSKD